MKHWAMAATLIASLGMMPVANGLEDGIKDNSPGTYIVVKGDTLWDIASTFLHSPWQWPQIWQANPEIDNPDLIYPGDEISLFFVGGEPRLMLTHRGDIGRTVKLGPKIRKTPNSEAIPPIPLEAIENYLHKGAVFTNQLAYEEMPYLFAGKEGKLAYAAGDQVYGRGPVNPNRKRFDVVRLNYTIADPVSAEVLGLVAEHVGEVRLERREQNVSVFRVASGSKELMAGDRLVPKRASGLKPKFMPTPPSSKMEGLVVQTMSDVQKASTYDSIVINLGERENLRVGDLLSIHRPMVPMVDPISKEPVALPPEQVGLVMIYRTFSKMSYGIVLTAHEEIEAGYLLRNLEL